MGIARVGLCALGVLVPPACASRPIALTSPVIVGPVRADTAPIHFNPRVTGVITLAAVELPEAGASIGGHFEGVQYQRQVRGRQMGDATRQQWMRSARDAGDSALLAAGFRILVPGPPSSDAEPLGDVRFVLAAVVTQLRVRTSGYVEPFQIEAGAKVEWELIDLSAGATVFEGHSEATARGAGSEDAAVDRVVAMALGRLVEQPPFQRALTVPRPLVMGELLSAVFARPMPRVGDTLTIGPGAQNLNIESGVLGGIVMLNGTRGYRSSAIVLTRDGLALTQASAGRQRWIWALHFDGRRRAARVLRTAGAVTLIELSCGDGCDTVPWDSDTTLADRSRVVWVGGASVPGSNSMGVVSQWRALKARRDREGVLHWSLRGRRPPVSGESVAREDGIVIGIATPGRVVPLADALRALSIERRGEP